MNLIPTFLRRKSKPALVIRQPGIWLKICDNCDYPFWQINIEGNPFPLGCPRCGQVQIN